MIRVRPCAAGSKHDNFQYWGREGVGRINRECHSLWRRRDDMSIVFVCCCTLAGCHKGAVGVS